MTHSPNKQPGQPSLAVENDVKQPVTQETISNFIALHAVAYEDLSKEIREREEGANPELWQIVGEYAGREGRLFFINPGHDPTFAAGRLVEMINEAGGKVQAWPPLPRGGEQRDKAWQPGSSTR